MSYVRAGMDRQTEMEAFVAAIYLDGGYGAAQEFIFQHMLSHLRRWHTTRHLFFDVGPNKSRLRTRDNL